MIRIRSWLFFILVSILSFIGNVSSEKYCITQACNDTAKAFLFNMNTSVDPCDDFYEFACGGFVNKTVIPSGESQVDFISNLTNLLISQLKTLVENNSTNEDIRPFNLVKKHYQACINEEKIELLGLKPLKKMLSRLGGWLVSENKNATTRGTKYNWLCNIRFFRKYGYSTSLLMDVNISEDLKNTSQKVLNLDAGSFGLDRFFLVKGREEPLVQAYFDYMKNAAVLLGHDLGNVEKDLENILNFEIQMANLTKSYVEKSNYTELYNRMHIKNLSQLNPCVPWIQYINQFFTPNLIQVEANDNIIVSEPSYISNLYTLMRNTSLKVIKDYVKWRVIKSSIPNLNKAAQNISNTFMNKLLGTTNEEERWKTCIIKVSNDLENAVGAMYIRKFFNESSKRDVKEMIGSIRKVFYKILNNTDWLGDETKQRALGKAMAMFEHIAFPSEYLDDSKLEERYKRLNLGVDTYFQNLQNLNIFSLDFQVLQLNKTVNKTDWVTHGEAAVVNAYYSDTENAFLFPAGILQGLLFSSDRPRYINLGAMGWIIGHEITHGFDNTGQQFDKDGNLENWWDEETENRFINRSKCFIEQYGNYTIKILNQTVDGELTLAENIADNGGIRQAYQAFMEWKTNNINSIELLPGLNFTVNQLFWLSGANTWCSKSHIETLRNFLPLDSHSPAIARVIMSFSNQKEFANDFNCPKDSSMNPSNRCQIW